MTTTFAVCNFDHPHVRFNVEHVHEHPAAELVTVCDEQPETSTATMSDVADAFDVPTGRRYADLDRCLRETDPDVAFLRPNTAAHAGTSCSRGRRRSGSAVRRNW